MITRLVRRLGFTPTVPVSVVDDWIMPRDDRATALAPRGGAATALVDRVGRVQPAGATWTLDWSLAAGARWVSAIEAERVTQSLIAPATLETSVRSPAGEIVHRVAAAVVGGEPVAIVEIENRGDHAVAVGVVARPLVHGGRGHVESASVDPSGIDVSGRSVRFDAAAATAVADGVDLLASMPEPDAGASMKSISSRSGAAQAAAVFPLPHTATVRLVVELGEPARADAAVPTIEDVARGWQRHLDAGTRFDVGDSPVAERLGVAARTLLTSWPTSAATPAAITALAELGFGEDVPRLLGDLERVDDDHAVLAAVARWLQLGDPHAYLDSLDRVIGPVARAAHVAGNATELVGESWLPWALGALAQRLDDIEQPDVAEGVRGILCAGRAETAESVGFDDLLKERQKLPLVGEPTAAARLALGTRSALLADRADGVDLLPALPAAWRGRTIDVLRAPVEGGTVSFGLRWHGPRPAVLWEVDRPGGPFTVTASAIDPDFSSDDPVGETLLADPGWPRS